jgi:uncharacterized protein
MAQTHHIAEYLDIPHHIDMFAKRNVNLLDLLDKKSHFLLGPRGTGKTSLIKESFGPSVPVIDLLSDDTYSRLLRRPSALSEFFSSDTPIVVIDEIQKIPVLLDEVHRLIELHKINFLLTGSSARKLRRGGANLLGGRAWEARLFPLTSEELKDKFDLIRYLNAGGLPAIYFSPYFSDELKNYIKLYIREEIQAESLIRRMDHFVRFLDSVATTNGEELNFESISNDSAVPARTVASYFELLEDTLLGFQVPPFTKTKKRKAIKRAKFYFFDVGVAGALAKRGEIQEGSELFGKAFEHFIAMELRSFLSYRNRDLPLQYWRSTTQYEVDFVIGDRLALEVKSTTHVSNRHLAGLQALKEEQLVQRYVVVCNEPVRRHVQGIEILPWKEFLSQLWTGELVS